MTRPVILGGAPYIYDYYRKTAAILLDETGGNTGNLAFRYAIANQLAAPAILPWHAPIQDIRAAGDVIVLPLANQLGAHTQLGPQVDRLEQIGLPIVGLGLGAQAKSAEDDIVLDPGTKLWLETLVKHSPTSRPNLGVRGPYTAAQIAKQGFPNATEVTGCPSNFINTQDDIARAVAAGWKRKIRHVAVAAGIPYIPSLAEIERSLAQIVTATGGAYIVQHGIEMLRLARREFDQMGPDVFALCKKYISPTSTDDEFKTWCRTYAYAFFDIRVWMDFLRRFDFVVGTRIHGVMLAIQAGVPAGCIAHDSRTMELCTTMAVPVRHFADIKAPLTCDNLLDYFEFDPEKYRETRRSLCSNYLSILASAGVRPSEGLLRVGR